MLIVLVPFVVGAAVLYFYGDHALWAWAWPLLVAVVALDLAGTLLSNYEFGNILHSRRLRTRLALEQALFFWKAGQPIGGDDTAVLRALEAARRAARWTPAAERVANILRDVRSGDATARRTIGDQLDAALGQLSSGPAERFPLGRGWMLPPDCIVPASVAAAFAGVVLFPVSSAANTLTPGALLQGLVLFGLAYVTLRLAVAVSIKLHSVISQKTFRVVMISSRQEFSAMGYLASELYTHISHLVHVHIDDELDGYWRSTLGGTYHVFVRQAGLADALKAFAGNADLIVLDTDGAAPELAATVKAMTDLPASRYLALSANEAVAPGYRWVEPQTLRVRPSDRRVRGPDIDFYLLGLIPGWSLWKAWLAQAFLLLGVLLALHGGALLAAVFFIAAIASVLPERVVPLRRATISRPTLRVPRALRFSHRLVPRALGFPLGIGFALLVLAATALVRPPIGIVWGSTEQALWPLKLVVAVLLSLAVLTLVSSTQFVLKWSIDWTFRFLVLRRNSSRFAYAHKVSVMAICGRYGQVVSLRDDTLDLTKKGFSEGREDALGSWFQIFSEIESTLRPVAFVHPWQRQVLLELEVTDFAVFDWIDEITENMRWELRCAGERLPAHRILVIHRAENTSEVDDFFVSCGTLFAQRPHCLQLSRGPDDKYIWADHSEFDRAFDDGLHQALSALAVEPRNAHPREITGSWPYPR
jgi:hypothetical protein